MKVPAATTLGAVWFQKKGVKHYILIPKQTMAQATNCVCTQPHVKKTEEANGIDRDGKAEKNGRKRYK